MAEFTIKIKSKRTDGPHQTEDEQAEGFLAALEGFTFEAGEDDSVYEVDSAEVV